MGNYALTRFTAPNAGVAVSDLGSDLSTTAALGLAVENMDKHAANLDTAGAWTALQSFGNFLGGTLQTAAQPNITSVGVLASPHMTGAVVDSGGLTVTAGTIKATAGAGSVCFVSATQGDVFQFTNGATLNTYFGVAASTNAQVTGSVQGDFFFRNNLNNGILFATNGDNLRMAIGASGAITFNSVGTTASAANAFLDNAASNNLLRSTSSGRYKDVLGPLTLAEALHIVTGVEATRYRSKSPADGFTAEFIGLIAEQVAGVDERLVTKDVVGRPDWVQYPILVAPLCQVVADIERRLTAAGL